MLEVGKILFLSGKAIQFFFRFFQVRSQLVDFSLALGTGGEEFSLGFLQFCLGISQFVAALEHEETTPHGVVGQEGGALQVFQTYGEYLFINGTVETVPPGGRQVFRKFHMVCIFKPLLLFVPEYAVKLAVGTDKAHISFPPLPLAPSVAEEHIPDETEHSGFTAFIFSHYDIEGRLGGLPGGIMINAVLLELKIGNFHFSSSFVSISAPRSSAF